MPAYVIGDLHGHYNIFTQLLLQSGLCDAQLQWIGDDSHLWMIGDLFDRGPNGLACLRLTLSLREQAVAVGGKVDMLLGNHEMMLLCARKFPGEFISKGVSIQDQWISWGGIESDMEAISDTEVQWLATRPLLALHGSTLLMHADNTMYIDYGHTVEEVNMTFKHLLASNDFDEWLLALTAFTEHKAFSQYPEVGKERAKQILTLYGANHLVHGHTPIPIASHQPASMVNSAWTYADGLCTNVDGALYMGGPGFVYLLEA